MIRAAVVLAWLAAPAHAEAIDLPNTRATLDVPATWKPVAAPGLVYGATGPANELLAITRAQVPNSDAWRRKKRDAYLDQIEKGLAAKLDGYRRVTRKLTERHAIPTLDIEARRDGGATVLIRVLLYRTYALALALEVPRRASTKPARAIVASFGPPPETTRATAP